MKKQPYKALALTLASICLLFTACQAKPEVPDGPPRDAEPAVLVPEASGEVVYEADLATMDASHSAEGYFMLSYSGAAQRVRVIVTAPDETRFTFPLSSGEGYHTFPLSMGAGVYQVSLYEGVENDERDDLYAMVFSQELEVPEIDPFTPFLYPNQYVNFAVGDEAVKLGAELAQDSYSEVEVLNKIYQYVITNITYDEALAENVSFGYIPDIDRTVTSKTGICFDYASLMAAMLRSQRIPTRLEVGYSGDRLHAWISAYLVDVGWVENIIEFTGSEWKLLDPTLAASNSSEQVKKYIGDGTRYLVKYLY